MESLHNAREMKSKCVSLVLPVDLVPQMDQRAGSLDMSRSQYVRGLVRQDLQCGVLTPAGESHLPRSARLSVKRSQKHTKETK